MDTLLAVLVGFSLAAWLLTLLGVGYAIWRYAFLPFGVLRRDVAALAQKAQQTDERLAELQRAVNPARVSAYSDAELAAIERRQRAAAAQRMSELAER